MTSSSEQLKDIKLSSSGPAFVASIFTFASITIFLLLGVFLPDAAYLMFSLAGLQTAFYAYAFSIYQAPAHLVDTGIQAGERRLEWDSIERVRFYFYALWGACLVTYRRQGARRRLLFLVASDEVLSSRVLTRWQKDEGREAVHKEDRILLYGSVIERA